MTAATATESVGQRARRLAQKLVVPAEIAAAVLAELGDDTDALRAALAEVLPTYCQKILTKNRADVRSESALDEGAAGDPPLHPALQLVREKQQRSAKIDAIRSWHERFLMQSVHVGGDHRKSMAECTIEDLRFAVAERRQQASVLRDRADQLEEIADLLEGHDCRLVGQLPADVVRAVFAKEDA